MKLLLTILCPIFLLAPALCADDNDWAGHAEEDVETKEVIVRRYILPKGLLGEDADGRQLYRVWPTVQYPETRFLDTETDSELIMQVEELVRSVIGDTLDLTPEYWCVASGSGELLVGADEGSHALIAELFGFMDQVWGDPLRIGITRLPASMAGDLEAGLISAQEAVQLSLSEHAESHVVPLGMGHNTRLRSGVSRAVTMGAESEVASSMATIVPIRGVLLSGRDLMLQAGPVEGGLALSMLSRQTTSLEQAARDRQLAVRICGEGGSGPKVVHEGVALDSCRSRTTCLATNYFLPTGKALVLEMGAGLNAGGIGEFLIIHKLGGGTKPVSTATLGNGMQLVFLPLDGLSLPRILMGVGVALDSLSTLPDVPRDEEGFFGVQFVDSGLEHLVLDTCDSSGEYQFTSFMGGGFFGLLDDEGQSEGISNGVALASGLTRPRASHVLSLEMFSGDQLMGRAALPIQEDHTLFLSLGEDFLVYPQMDSEIASYATAPALNPAMCLDGLALTAEVSVNSSGKHFITLDGLACATEEGAVEASQDSLYGSIDRPVMKLLPLRGTHRLAPTDDGGWELTLKAANGLGVEIRLR